MNTDTGTTFIPLQEVFDGGEHIELYRILILCSVPNPNRELFGNLAECVIPLKSRLECLELLFQSVPVHISSMQVAYQLFDNFGIQVRNE